MQLAVATAANISTPAWEASSWTHGYHAVLYAAAGKTEPGGCDRGQKRQIGANAKRHD
jgi:hypothetical protein